MARHKQGKFPRPEPADARERARQIIDRVSQQRGSGRFIEQDRIRDEQIAEHKRRLEEQIAADDRSITEKVPEYVLDYDDGGNYIGLKPAKPPTPDQGRQYSTVRPEQ